MVKPDSKPSQDLKPETEYRVDLYIIPVHGTAKELVSQKTVTFKTLPPVQGEKSGLQGAPSALRPTFVVFDLDVPLGQLQICLKWHTIWVAWRNIP